MIEVFCELERVLRVMYIKERERALSARMS